MQIRSAWSAARGLSDTFKLTQRLNEKTERWLHQANEEKNAPSI